MALVMADGNAFGQMLETINDERLYQNFSDQLYHLTMKTRNVLCHRLTIRGDLCVPQALHIGSGQASRRTDAPIRRDHNGQPYIPGSTLAGLLLATARDFAPYFFDDWKNALTELFGQAGEKSQASRLVMEDAPLTTSLPPSSEVRDHVGMDRRKGAARPRLQYDQEVTPSNTRYRFEVSLEEPTGDEIRLLLAVLDFWSELDFALHIGGRSTTGLGKARLDRDSLTFYRFDFSNPQILRAYLTGDDTPQAAKVNRVIIEPPPASFHKPKDNKPRAETFRPQHLFITVALVPEEPLLVQGAVPKIPEGEPALYGPGRVSDADFVTALTRSTNDAGQLRERQYVPGSSLKGVLRTQAEQIVRTLTFHRCAAQKSVDVKTDAGYRAIEAEYQSHICACAITHDRPEEGSPGTWKEPDKLLACFGTSEKQRRAQDAAQKTEKIEGQEDTTFARELYAKSCITCRVFGNTMMRGRLHVSDAVLVVEPTPKLFDHVAIDRFHGGAEDKRKFDTRPLMPKLASEPQIPASFEPMFTFELHLERPEPWMLGLLAHLLKDLKTGDLHLGHATHRGYGRVSGRVIKAEREH